MLGGLRAKFGSETRRGGARVSSRGGVNDKDIEGGAATTTKYQVEDKRLPAMSDFDPFDPDDEAGIVKPYGGIHEAPEIQDEEERQEIYLNAVQNLTNALGGWEFDPEADGGKGATIYRPGDSVLPVLKDLKKMWRKDDTDDERTVARCMHTAGLMKELVSLVCEVTMRGEWGRKVSLMACE